MKIITFSDAAPGELAYSADSGRAFRVQVFRVLDFSSDIARRLGMPENGPEFRGDHYLAFRIRQADPTTGTTVTVATTVTIQDADGNNVQETQQQPVEHWEGRHIPGSLIASGADSHTAYWKLFYDLKDPKLNPVQPDGVSDGQSVVDANGATWYAGYGPPDQVLAAGTGVLGDFYVDLKTGNFYKRREGLISWVSRTLAQEMDTLLETVSQTDQLGIPQL